MTNVKPMQPTDNALARAAAQGDRSAFSTLLERHYDRIFALAFRLTGRRSEAEDLAQDICAALPSKLARFDGRARFTTWLYRVVLNAAHDRRRRAQTHQRAAQGWGDWEVERRADIAETKDRLDWLTRAMRALPEDLRDTLALTLDDMTHAQAAEILGISEGTVSWRLSEARKHLRTLKEKEDIA
jgi:RNA polymerase sigma-70 factor (ECF subfamily)